jgi:cell division protein ZapA (FtsZ GTPase activity inhibitor)
MTKDARVTVRLTADEHDQLEAIAEEEDVSVAHLVRRGVRMLLAGTAVLVAVLMLSACGGTAQPKPAQTTMTLDQARQAVEAKHTAELEAEATALAGGCTLTGPGTEFDQRWNSYPSALTATDVERAAAGDAMVTWIDAQPAGCTDADVALIRDVRAGAVLMGELDD